VRPIIVGLGPSHPCSSALDWALVEARRRSRPVELLLARGTPLPGQFGIVRDTLIPEPLAHKILQQATDHAEAHDPSVQVHAHVRDGGPAGVLVEASRDADSVVVGRHGSGQMADALLGSTSAQVAAHAHAPVVVVSDQVEHTTAGRVVLGVDGSQANEAAIRYAFDAALRRGVPLVAVYAWHLELAEKVTMPWVSEHTLHKLAEEQQRVLYEALAGWSEQYPDVQVRHVVSRLPPVDLLVARARKAGLLVLGSRGHGGFPGLKLGSVSQGILHRPGLCPVAIVPGPAQL